MNLIRWVRRISDEAVVFLRFHVVPRPRIPLGNLVSPGVVVTSATGMFLRSVAPLRALVCFGVLVGLACSHMAEEQREYVSELVKFRTKKDLFMASEQGPLTEAQRDHFKGLAYFNPNFDLIFETSLQTFAIVDTLELITSKETTQPYLRIGKLPFEFDGKHYELTLYRAVHGEYLFLPYMDATNGAETYGGGRYMDVEKLPNGAYKMDFNLAYNPYCAYNPSWICPIPPAENRLPFAVKAGERMFPYPTGMSLE